MNSFRIYFDGQPITACPGQTLAFALWRAGIRTLRRSVSVAEPRGIFCGMGVCQECVVWMNGRRVEACMIPVKPDLRAGSDEHS
jgi:aerobic-type carbon monoxide dehydrogenase small subunit (CoxS/CutS family)